MASSGAVHSSSSSSSSFSSSAHAFPPPPPGYLPAPPPPYPTWLMTRAELDASSPSRADGLDAEKEHTLRKAACAGLSEIGVRVFGGKKEAIPTALIFFHRFFVRRSFLQDERMAIACACLMAAGKCVDFGTPPKLESLIPEYLQRTGHTPPFHEKTEIWVTAKDTLMQAERQLLFVLEYDIDVDTPARYVEQAMKQMNILHDSPLYEGAIRAANEALRTTLCVQYDAKTLALGCVTFSKNQIQKVNKLPPQVTPEVWEAAAGASQMAPEAAIDIINQLRETLALTKKVLAGAGGGGGSAAAANAAAAVAANAAASSSSNATSGSTYSNSSSSNNNNSNVRGAGGGGGAADGDDAQKAISRVHFNEDISMNSKET